MQATRDPIDTGKDIEAKGQAVIVLSVVMLQGGYLGAVVISGDAEAITIVRAESLEVGHLEALPERTEEGKDKQRVLSDPEIEGLIQNVVDLFYSERCEKIVLESPSMRRSPMASRLFTTLRDRLALLSLPIESVFSAWRFTLGSPALYRSHARENISRLCRDISALKYDSVLFAAALVVHQLTPENQAPREHTERAEPAARIEKTGDGGNASSSAKPAETSAISELGQCPTRSEAPSASELETPSVSRSVLAGLDSGSHYVGLTIAQGEARPLEALFVKTFHLGEEVPLKKPRVIERKDGGQTTILTKRVVSFESVSALSDRIVETLRAYQVTDLCVEYVDSVHIDKGQHRAASSVATEILKASWVWILVSERARVAGIRVIRTQAASWRSKVCGKTSAHGEAAKLIPQAVKSGFANWPKRTNNHEQDSGGIVLGISITRERELAEQRKLASAKPKRVRKAPLTTTANKKRSDRIRAEREAAGCTCAKKHMRGCPLYKPTKVPDWAKGNV